MEYKVSDKVRIKSINQILSDELAKDRSFIDISSAKYCGEVHTISSISYLEGELYCLENVHGLWSAKCLEPLEKICTVCVGWDMSQDLSITEYQYKRICSQSEKTGCTTAEVLQMLVAAGMQLMGDDESSC